MRLLAGHLGEALLAERAARRTEAVAVADADLSPLAVGVARRGVAFAAATVLRLLLGPAAQLEHLARHRALRHVDQHSLVVGHALADPVEAGVVGATLEHGVRRVDTLGVLDRLDQAGQVALDELVLQREGGGGHHDAAVVEQRRHEVAERLAGAGAGLHQQVLLLDHRVGDGLGHLHLTRPLGPAELLDRRGQHAADRVVARAGIWHPSTLVAGWDRRSSACTGVSIRGRSFLAPATRPTRFR